MSALELSARCFIKIGSKLGECRELSILCQRKANAAAEFLDDIRLCRTADTRYRKTGVYRRTDTSVKEIGLEKNLAIGDRDHIGRYECRYVTGLGLDDRQGGQRACSAFDLAA